MGTWGHGNFQNDGALDYVGELIHQLTNRVESCFEGTRLDPDEEGEDVLVPSIHIMTLLCRECGAVPPNSETIRQWKGRYLQNWDATIDGLDPDPDFKVERRRTILETFDRLIELAETY